MFDFILMNLMTFLVAYLIAAYFLRFNSTTDFLSALFIVYFSIIVLNLLSLGILKALYLQNIILINLSVLLTVYSVIKFYGLKRRFNFKDNFTNVATRLKPNKVEIICLSVILGFGLVKILINIVNPPFGWDDLNYHFTFPVEWLKNGSLQNPIVVSCDPSPTYYPINGSLFYFWLILPLKNVFIADLGQIPFFILVFLSVYSIARKLALSRELAFYAASLFLLIPNFFKQLEIAYVDVMVAGLFLACLNFMFLLANNFSWTNVLLWAMSFGLFVGTKTVALPYSLLLFAPFAYLQIKNFRKSYLFLFALIFIIGLGGFTYLRNFIHTGNPLYPLELKLFGRDFLKGVMASGVYRAHFKAEDYRIGKLLFHEGLSAQAILLILPSMFLALPLAIWKKRKEVSFYTAYFLILPLLIFLVYRYIIPLANVRYLYPLLGTGIIVAFYVLRLFNIPRAVINALVLICVLASVAELANRTELISALILTILFVFLLPPALKLTARLIKKPILLLLLFIFIITGIAFLNEDYNLNEFSRYSKMVKYSGFWPEATEAWSWLNKNTRADNIAYIGRPVPFPLYGQNFKNNVYYVSVNKIEPARLHYFPHSKYVWGFDGESVHASFEEEKNYRGKKDYLVWSDNLLRRRTDYLFVYSLHQIKTIQFPTEDLWAGSHPEIFDLVFKNAIVHIYKIKK